MLRASRSTCTPHSAYVPSRIVSCRLTQQAKPHCVSQASYASLIDAAGVECIADVILTASQGRGLKVTQAVTTEAVLTVPLQHCWTESTKGSVPVQNSALHAAAPSEVQERLLFANQLQKALEDTPQLQLPSLVALAAWLLWLRNNTSAALWPAFVKLLPATPPCLLTFTPSNVDNLQFPFLQNEARSQCGWVDYAHPTLVKLGVSTNLDDSVWALSMVRSRSLSFTDVVMRQRPRGGPPRQAVCSFSCLVPGIDMANHSFTPNCEFQLSYDGSSISLVPLRPLEAGESVLVNYGPFTSLDLMANYGFILPANPHDRIPWGRLLPGADLPSPLFQPPPVLAAARHLLPCLTTPPQRQRLKNVVKALTLPWSDPGNDAAHTHTAPPNGPPPSIPASPLVLSTCVTPSSVTPSSVTPSSVTPSSCVRMRSTQLDPGMLLTALQQVLDACPTTLHQDEVLLTQLRGSQQGADCIGAANKSAPSGQRRDGPSSRGPTGSRQHGGQGQMEGDDHYNQRNNHGNDHGGDHYNQRNNHGDDQYYQGSSDGGVQCNQGGRQFGGSQAQASDEGSSQGPALHSAADQAHALQRQWLAVAGRLEVKQDLELAMLVLRHMIISK